MTIKPDHDIPSGGLVDIFYPSSVAVVSTSTCNYETTVVTASTCSSDSTKVRITITAGYLSASGNLKVIIGAFQNPRTFNPTSSFSFVSYDSTGARIDQGTGFSLTMTSRGPLDAVTVSSGSQVNGATTTYTITLTSNNIPLANGDQFFITFPAEITLAVSTCSGVSQITSVLCTSPSAN